MLLQACNRATVVRLVDERPSSPPLNAPGAKPQSLGAASGPDDLAVQMEGRRHCAVSWKCLASRNAYGYHLHNEHQELCDGDTTVLSAIRPFTSAPHPIGDELSTTTNIS